MADEFIAKKVEVAGQIICELIRKGILPTELERNVPATELAELLGKMYQIIWKATYTAPESK